MSKGTTIPFHSDTPSVQIDHVVALEDAWQKGAQQLDPQTRQNFANDPRNRQATDGPTNEQKGGRDAATWLPPNKAYRCTYLSRIVDVKSTYGLWVTQPEHDQIARILSNCNTPASPSDVSVVPRRDRANCSSALLRSSHRMRVTIPVTERDSRRNNDD
jgi:Protein of unknown function (DUF1524)